MVSVPVHAPCQPWKAEPLAGVAVRVIVPPVAKPKEQVCPQSIPAGELLIVPAPEPDLLTVSVVCANLKLAVTVCAALNVTVQVLVVPAHAPDQPSKLEPAAGVAVRVISVPGAKLAVQVVPQSIPAGLLVIAPVPAPVVFTVSATGIKVKPAPTVCASAIVTVQVVAVPVHAPVQPSKLELAVAVAVKVTVEFWLKLALQVAPQSIPAGALVIVPVPVPVLFMVRPTWMASKLAVTVCAAPIVTVHVAVVPVHAPDQPVKVEPAAAVAVRVTVLFWLKLVLQVAPQSIPAGLLETVPAPDPDLVIANWTGIAVNVAVTALAAVMATVHVVVDPVHAPAQLVKVEPAVGAAVRVTLAFWLKLAVQVVPQLMPAGLLVTVPAPVPDLVMANAIGTALKVAVTLFAAFMVTVQVLAVPLQAPDQPEKAEPALGAAVRVTLAFRLKLAEQAVPQVMRVGELVTVPDPVPALVTVNSRTGIKLAVAVLAVLAVTVQVVAVPVQAPLQPLNRELVPAVAVRVTVAVLAKLKLQVLPQLIPAGELVTVPVPVPVLVTVSLAAWARLGTKLRASRAITGNKRALVINDVMSATPYCGNTRFCRRDNASYTLVWLRANWPLGSVRSSLILLPMLSNV